MQQRQLRLGDNIDDYCPRERRLTNHAVVAMVGDEVKQTRCMTCDAEHPYKRAQVPVARRKKESVSSAYRAVLSSVQQEEAGFPVVARVAESARDAPPAPLQPVPAAPPPPPAPLPPPSIPPPAVSAAPPARAAHDRGADEGRVHRRLIRAQLPRVEGKEPTPRPIPQFTVHDPRAASFRSRGGQRGGGSGGRHGSRGPFARDASARGGGFALRPPKPSEPGRHAHHGGRSRKPGKKQPK